MSLVSIAMATYNGEKFLKEQLDSIVNQTYKNLEIIICDDCSTDSTIDIIKDFQKRDRRIKLYQNEKQLGVLKNFEKAISLCSGEYIAISDQDDIWIANKIETMLSEIGDNILIYHDDSLIDEKGDLICESFYEFYNETPYPTIKNYYYYYYCISGHSLMFKNNLIKKILPIPIEAEFYDWWIGVNALAYGNIKYIPLQLVKWRAHSTNSAISKTTKNKKLLNFNTIKEWNRARITKLRLLKKHFPLHFHKEIDNAIKFHSNCNRIKCFVFAIRNINKIVTQKNIMRKLKYIIFPLIGPKVDC